ncbi:hypothetical protein [Escherichia coli]|uniref:hypothetical protein n=1 Tax=Escherichia coli TaxID=562 RepID=UPI002FF3C947
MTEFQMKIRPLLGCIIAILFLLGIDVLCTPEIPRAIGEFAVCISIFLWLGASIANIKDSEDEIDALKFHSEVFISICFGLCAYFLVKFGVSTDKKQNEMYAVLLIASSITGFSVFILYWISQRKT